MIKANIYSTFAVNGSLNDMTINYMSTLNTSERMNNSLLTMIFDDRKRRDTFVNIVLKELL